MKPNYYISSFFWSTISKVLNAGLNFISIPLLLALYGKSEYGILSLAITANTYMAILDLGFNIGAIKFFSQWRYEGNYKLMHKVVGTSISFYAIIGIINALFLLLLALEGERLFNISPEEFLLLRRLFFILALFSIFNWVTTIFSQLLISANKITYTQQCLCVLYLLKFSIVYLAIFTDMPLEQYFFYYSLALSLLVIPYYCYCKHLKLIKSAKPLFYWKDSKIIFTYSLLIFALTFFQMTAANSRPLILGIFAMNATSVLTEYRIIEVFPIFILSVGGMLTSILLPKASKIVRENNVILKERMVYMGTKYTTILSSFLCFPIILIANEILILYVGEEFQHLAIWMRLWCFTLILSLHSTPCNSLVLAIGKTKPIVIITALSCVFSIIINILICLYWLNSGVSSAIIGYFIYVLVVMSFNYIYYYPKLLNLKRKKLFFTFLNPTLLALFTFLIVYIIMNLISSMNIIGGNLLLNIFLKIVLWMGFYISFLHLSKIIKVRELRFLEG